MKTTCIYPFQVPLQARPNPDPELDIPGQDSIPVDLCDQGKDQTDAATTEEIGMSFFDNPVEERILAGHDSMQVDICDMEEDIGMSFVDSGVDEQVIVAHTLTVKLFQAPRDWCPLKEVRYSTSSGDIELEELAIQLGCGAGERVQVGCRTTY